MLRILSRWLPLPACRPIAPRWRLHVTHLEDRSTPASFAGNTITLDIANEVLSISTSASGTYTLTSTADVNGTTGSVNFTPAAGLVTVVDSATGTSLRFESSTANYANSFAVTLDDTPGPGSVSFSGSMFFAVPPSRPLNLSVTTTRDIVVNIGATVSSTAGNITFSANRQTTPPGGSFVGVDVQGTVTSNTGNVVVSGRGGTNPGTGQMGVRLSNGGHLYTTGSGAVSVTGDGGGGYTPFVGGGGLSGHDGVVVTGSGSFIASGGGDVTVVGSYSAAAGQSRNYGVLVSGGGSIAAGGTGAVSVTGGGRLLGTITSNEQDGFMLVTGAGSAVTSAGGPVNLQRDVNSDLRFISVGDGATVASGGNATVTITANALGIGPTATVSAGSGTVRIIPYQAALGLGFGDSFNNYPGSVTSLTPTILGLTDAELDRITAGTLILGVANTRVQLAGAITLPAATDVQLVGGDLTLSGNAALDTGGGTLTLNLSGVVNLIESYTTSGPDLTLTASTVSFAAGAGMVIPPGAAAYGAGSLLYTSTARLVVNGTLDLTNLYGTALNLPTAPTPGSVYTLATATNIVGTFVGRPEGSTITVNGVPLTLHYTATSVTAVYPVSPLPPSPPGVPPSPPVVPPPPLPLPRVVTAVGDAVTLLNPIDGSTRTFVPFPGFSVSVASADLTGDRVPELVVGAGPGGGPHVRVFDGATGVELASFFAFPTAFSGGVSVAATNGQVVVGAVSGGGPQVKVFDANRLRETRPNGELADSALLATFFAFDVSFTGGVRVAVGDVNTDGVPDVVVGAASGGGPHVKGIDGRRLGQVQPSGVIADSALFANFFAFDPGFTGGVSVAATFGRFAVGAGAGGGPHVKLYDRTGTNVAGLFAFDPGFTGGVRVGFTDADADGDVDLLTGAGPGGGPHLKAFNLAPFVEVRSVFVGYPTDPRGVVV